MHPPRPLYRFGLFARCIALKIIAQAGLFVLIKSEWEESYGHDIPVDVFFHLLYNKGVISVKERA